MSWTGFFILTIMQSIVTTTDNSICLYVGLNLVVEIKRSKAEKNASLSVWYLGTHKFDSSIHTVAEVSTAKYSAEEIAVIGTFLVAMSHDMDNKTEATT